MRTLKNRPLGGAIVPCATALLFFTGVVAGCSSSDKTTPEQTPDGGNQSANSSDQGGATVDTLAPDTAPPKPACDYPQGPYGTSEAATVVNMEFEAFADSDFLCKESQNMVMDNETLRKISFADFYCSPTCPDKKRDVLWVIVSAGWCQPCRDEVKATQAEYGKGAVDKRVHVVNIVYEDDESRPVTQAFAKLWTRNQLFQLTMPVAMDPTFQMGKYFDRNAVPFNMLVDLSTMKIIYRQTGGELRSVGMALQSFLNK